MADLVPPGLVRLYSAGEPATCGFVNHRTADASLYNSSSSKSNAGELAFCLVLLQQKSPDLAMLVERWDSLPDAVRAGIVAMVRAAGR